MTKGQMALVLCVALVAGLTGGVMSGRLATAKGSAPAIIEAQEFRLVDAQGRSFAALRFTEPGRPVFELQGPAGVGPAVRLSINQAGEARVFLKDAGGVFRTGLSIAKNGVAGVVVNDATGRYRASLMERGGAAQLTITRTNPRPMGAATLMVNRLGTPSLLLRDDQGKNRLVLSLDQKQQPLLAAFGPESKLRWAAP